jgi:hypothetical protein
LAATVGVVVAATALAGCGGGARQDAKEPNGKFPVDVTSATFPASQRLAQHTHLVIKVRNAGNKMIPNLAVTILDPSQGTSAQAFGADLSGAGATAGLASRSRPVWIVDSPPGPCRYSCRSGGPGGDVTAYANTWALGRPLKPGDTATFDWGVTAIKPGRHTVQYQVAAGLNGKARAVLPGGGRPWGTFTVTVAKTPARSYVTDSGKIVTTQ